MLTNNEAALIVAILEECRVEEAFARLNSPGTQVRFNELDYKDMPTLLSSGVTFEELSKIYHRKEWRLKDAYYRNINKYDLYNPRVKKIESIDDMDKIIIVDLVQKAKPVEFIINRFPNYSPLLLEEMYVQTRA